MSCIELTVIGSGDAFNSAGRGHSCYWIEGVGTGPLMVDFGATALEGLRRAGCDPCDLHGLLFTHLHGDHIGGLPYLFIDAVFRSHRRTDLALCGPPKTMERHLQMLEATYGDVHLRDRSFEFVADEIRAGETREFRGARVEAFRAEHMDPPEQALGLVIHGPAGERLVFSGDTAMTDQLIEAARGADLLVAECSGLAHPAGRHCVWEEWRELLPALGAKQVILTHLSEEVRAAAPELLTEIPEEVNVEFADDGMRLRLEPAEGGA